MVRLIERKASRGAALSGSEQECGSIRLSPWHPAINMEAER